MPEPEAPLERLGSGRAAEVFAWDEGTVVKLSRRADGLPSLETESAALSAARSGGVRVPAPRGFVTHDGRPGLLLERLAGDDVLSIAERQPWRIRELGRLIGRLHAELGRTAAPESLPELKTAARALIEASPAIPAAARPRVLALLNALPDSDRLCHGDFHPGNIMLTAEGPVIIDFPNAVRGDAVADFARTLIIFEAGAPASDTSPWARFLIRVARRLMLRAYRSAYLAESPVDDALLGRWRVATIAHRLTEQIPEERVALLRMLSRSLRAAGA